MHLDKHTINGLRIDTSAKAVDLETDPEHHSSLTPILSRLTKRSPVISPRPRETITLLSSSTVHVIEESHDRGDTTTKSIFHIRCTRTRKSFFYACLVIIVILAGYGAYEISVMGGFYDRLPHILHVPPAAYGKNTGQFTELEFEYYHRIIQARKRSKWELSMEWDTSLAFLQVRGGLFGFKDCEENAKPSKFSIPKILHQVNTRGELSYPWDEMSRNCTKMSPEWEYRYWTKEKIHSFMQENYPWFMPQLNAYPFEVMTADAVRYFILYHYGGIYLDTDVECKKDLDSYVPYLSAPVVFGGVGVWNGFSQWFMITPPKHPIFESLITNLGPAFELHDGTSRKHEILFSTGPRYAQFTVQKQASTDYCRIPPRLIAPCDITMFGAKDELPAKCRRPCICPECYTIHHHGSSWHLEEDEDESFECPS